MSLITEERDAQLSGGWFIERFLTKNIFQF